MLLRWRQFRRLLRWNSVLFPLAAAVVAGIATLLPMTHGGNEWCNNNAFSCSVSTNLLGVVLVAGFTSYWYYGFRRTLLLARHRREVLSRLRREGPPGNEIPAQGAVHDAVIDMVLDDDLDVSTRLGAASIALPFLYPRLSATTVDSRSTVVKIDGAALIEKLNARLERLAEAPIVESIAAEAVEAA